MKATVQYSIKNKDMTSLQMKNIYQAVTSFSVAITIHHLSMFHDLLPKPPTLIMVTVSLVSNNVLQPTKVQGKSDLEYKKVQLQVQSFKLKNSLHTSSLSISSLAFFIPIFCSLMQANTVPHNFI